MRAIPSTPTLSRPSESTHLRCSPERCGRLWRTDSTRSAVRSQVAPSCDAISEAASSSSASTAGPCRGRNLLGAPRSEHSAQVETPAMREVTGSSPVSPTNHPIEHNQPRDSMYGKTMINRRPRRRPKGVPDHAVGTRAARDLVRQPCRPRGAGSGRADDQGPTGRRGGGCRRHRAAPAPAPRIGRTAPGVHAAQGQGRPGARRRVPHPARCLDFPDGGGDALARRLRRPTPRPTGFERADAINIRIPIEGAGEAWWAGESA